MTRTEESHAALAQLDNLDPDTWEYHKEITKIYIPDLREKDISRLMSQQNRILDIWLPGVQRQAQNKSMKKLDQLLENLNQLQYMRINLVNAYLNQSYDTALIYDAQGHYTPTPAACDIKYTSTGYAADIEEGSNL